MTLKLCRGEFFEEYDPTIECSYQAKIIVNGQEQLLEIMDTTGAQSEAMQPPQIELVFDGYFLGVVLTSIAPFLLMS